MNPFEEIIRSLSELMGIPLKVDANQACRLQIEENLFIQIDLAKDADQILIGASLGKLTAGSYRNEIFLEALRANGMTQIPRGILAYSIKTNSLYLFEYLYLLHLDGAKLLQFLERFSLYALLWYKALLEEKNPAYDLEAVLK